MAVTGAIIVMLGLSTLSFIISQLHRIISLFERRPPDIPEESQVVPADLTTAEAHILSDPGAAARIYQPLSADLGQKFALSQLYQIANQENLPHPYLTIRSISAAGLLVSKGEGVFAWKEI